VGSRTPLSVGTAGTVLLAQLPDREVRRWMTDGADGPWKKSAPRDVLGRVARCRKSGYAADWGGTHPSLHAVSIPLPLPGVEDAALTVFGLPEECPARRLPTLLKNLHRTCRDIRKQLDHPA
jgi:DNA-binding IclR family transcriptional regulator